MISALRKQKTPYASTANIVDGKLILSCPGAVIPAVWQMDMAEVKASALEVFEDDKAGSSGFILRLRTLKDDFVTIAGFATKDEAVMTLMAVTSALQNAHGMIRPAGAAPAARGGMAGSSCQRRHKGKRRWGVLFLALIVLGGLMFLFSGVRTAIPPVPDSSGNMEIGQNQAPQNGVPLSAEEFLKNNR